jgi:hypothetical protein
VLLIDTARANAARRSAANIPAQSLLTTPPSSVAARCATFSVADAATLQAGYDRLSAAVFLAKNVNT